MGVVDGQLVDIPVLGTVCLSWGGTKLANSGGALKMHTFKLLARFPRKIREVVKASRE